MVVASTRRTQATIVCAGRDVRDRSLGPFQVTAHAAVAAGQSCRLNCGTAGTTGPSGAVGDGKVCLGGVLEGVGEQQPEAGWRPTCIFALNLCAYTRFVRFDWLLSFPARPVGRCGCPDPSGSGSSEPSRPTPSDPPRPALSGAGCSQDPDAQAPARRSALPSRVASPVDGCAGSAGHPADWQGHGPDNAASACNTWSCPCHAAARLRHVAQLQRQLLNAQPARGRHVRYFATVGVASPDLLDGLVFDPGPGFLQARGTHRIC